MELEHLDVSVKHQKIIAPKIFQMIRNIVTKTKIIAKNAPPQTIHPSIFEFLLPNVLMSKQNNIEDNKPITLIPINPYTNK